MKLFNWGIICVCMLIVWLSPSADSIWIDEAMTANYAQLPDTGAFVRQLLADSNSEAQMPLFLFQAFIFEKLLGASEWALRAPNILYGLLAAGSLFWLSLRYRMPWLPLLLVLHPYFVFYLNEARPYAMQMGFAALTLAALVPFWENSRDKRLPAALLMLGLISLCGASMLGALFAGCVYSLLAAFLFTRQSAIKPVEWGILAMGTLLLCILGAYYGWTLLQGSAGSRMWEVSLKNIAFSLYEFSGASGYGPARHELRAMGQAGGMATVLKQVLPGLLALSGLLAALALHWLLQRVRKKDFWRLDVAFIYLLASTWAALLLLSILADWPFWGRHLAPSFPCFIVWLGFALRELIEKHPVIGKSSGVALLLALGVSAAQLRVNEKHLRDDYRSAASYAEKALQAKDQQVWWVASRDAARYYNLPEDSGLTYLHNPMPEDLQALPLPDYIVLSKPDIYDAGGTIRSYMEAHHYREDGGCQSFTFFIR